MIVSIILSPLLIMNNKSEKKNYYY
jgi:hypothetical protein